MKKEIKSKNTAVRMTPSDFDKYTKIAESQHITLGNWIRIALIEKEIRDAKKR